MLALAAFYLSFIGWYGFVGPDEPRYARIAEEMMRRNDWVLPTLKGHPWLEKPPLLYWLAIVSYRIFGVNEFAARLPSSLLALGAVAALYLALRRAFGERMAFNAALALGTSVLFLGFAGAGTTDMPFTACISVGLLLLWRYLDAEPAPPPTLLWAASAVFGLAVLAKGPLGLLLPALAVYPYLIITGRVERLTLPRLAAGLLVILAVAAPWYVLVYLREGFFFILVFFVNHNLARFFTTIHHHTKPFYFFLPVVLIGLIPWTFFLLLCRRSRAPFWRRFREDPRADGLLFFASWLALPFLFFSLSTAKLPGYVLPLFPALAVMAAWSLEGAFTPCRDWRPFAWGAAALAVVLAVGGPVFFHIRFHLVGLGLLAAALALPGLLGFIWLIRRGRPDRAVLSLALAVFMVVVGGAPFLLPAVEPFFSGRRVCRLAMQWTGRDNPLVIYRHFHHSHEYYTDYTCTPNVEKPAELAALLALRDRPAFLLTEKRALADLVAVSGWRRTVVTEAGRSVLVKLERTP
jgi:4-amino-4-deoxy-L-arabinose transferase-like glycosyltransferase